ncbi:MAG: 16S rRNA (guanine(527)-N(7))-methyltransferase RsmG [Rubellimicrobium sp.]|nr:16S rRNA (guanine(527)-N(7))-methyltransferase RsmG [Rubellimicrobium sp.]
MSRIDIPGLDVSRETDERLRALASLIVRWTRKINLIAPDTISTIWDRHIRDSAQLVRFAPATTTSWVDLGSGAGLPGLVVATILSGINPDATVTLIESDRRKAAFLEVAKQELSLTVEIRSDRAESLPPLRADVLSARALAPLGGLLALASRHLSPSGLAIFPKGRTWEQEVAEARQRWQFGLAIHDSLTDHQARILLIKGISLA